jgi:putative sigma-54 modulation protein
MEVDIAGRHFHVTEALKDYALEKVEKLDKYSLKLESVHIIFEVQKFRHICELVAAGKKLRLKAKEDSADMYAAFDKSFGNIQLQLRRQHEKVKDHKGRRYSVASDKKSSRKSG